MLKPLKGEWDARHGGSQEETAQMCLLKPGRVGQVDSENYGASGHRHLGETDCTLREAPAMPFHAEVGIFTPLYLDNYRGDLRFLIGFGLGAA